MILRTLSARFTSELLFWGLVYGALWWFLGPLTLLPILLGQSVTWDLVSGQNLPPSLFGHLAYGAVTAAVFAWRQAPVIRIHLATVARGVMAARGGSPVARPPQNARSRCGSRRSAPPRPSGRSSCFSRPSSRRWW